MSALSSGQRVERLRVRLDQPEIKRFWLKTKTKNKSAFFQVTVRSTAAR